MLQCVAVCCSVEINMEKRPIEERDLAIKKSFAVCCSVLQRVAVCCSVLQCVAVCESVLPRERKPGDQEECCSVL